MHARTSFLRCTGSLMQSSDIPQSTAPCVYRMPSVGVHMGSSFRWISLDTALRRSCAQLKIRTGNSHVARVTVAMNGIGKCILVISLYIATLLLAFSFVSLHVTARITEVRTEHGCERSDSSCEEDLRLWSAPGEMQHEVQL